MSRKKYCEMCDKAVKPAVDGDCPDCGAGLQVFRPTYRLVTCPNCEGDGCGPSWQSLNCPRCGGRGKVREAVA